MGTLDYYMAPERFLTGHGDFQVDIYSLGCLLYETLTGQKPFPGEGLPAQMYAHVHTPPPAPSQHRAGLPAALDAVVAKGMAKDPTQRFRSAGQLASATQAALSGPRTGPSE